MTDSKPFVQAFTKLARGEFSNSPRLATFLSIGSRYQVSIRHLAGKVNVPSDFASRNAPDCEEPKCQVCKFVKEIDECVVHSVTIADVLSGSAIPPFANRPAWKALQLECSDLRRVRAHLLQGTRPSKKTKNARNIKRYLNVVTLSHDGLVVGRKEGAFMPSRDLMAVPVKMLPALLTALHITFDHPSSHQLQQNSESQSFCLEHDHRGEGRIRQLPYVRSA